MPEIKENPLIEVNRSSPEIDTKYNHREILTDVEVKTHVPESVRSWLEKIEDDPQPTKSVQDDSGQAVLSPSTNPNPKIVLPVTRAKFIEGFKLKFDQAGRWLSGFLLKLIKKKKGNVKFK